MIEPPKTHPIAQGHPALWGLMGILIAGCCHTAINTINKAFEISLILSKAGYSTLRWFSILSTITEIVLVAILAIVFVKLGNKAQKTSHVWIVVLLIFWPLLSFTQYTLSVNTLSIMSKTLSINELQIYQKLKIALGMVSHVAYLLTVVITTIYLIAKRRPGE